MRIAKVTPVIATSKLKESKEFILGILGST